MVPLAALLAVRAFMSASITTYLPTFLSEEGADFWLAGASLSILEAAGVLGALLGGSLSDRLGRKLLGFAVISTTPFIMALVQESYPDNRALANGVYMGMSFLIRSVVVILLGGIGDLYGLRQGFIFSGILMLLGTPIILLLPQARNGPNA